MNNQKKLHKTISDVSGVPESSINEKSSQDNIEKWDSLAIVNMVTELEMVFTVQFDVLEILEFYSVEIIKLTLMEKGLKF